MARTEADKEDLIADATALVERAEFMSAVAASIVPWQCVVAGYRRNGSLSLYFDQDPFYQFEANGTLRRALVDSHLFRPQESGLAQLDRERTSDQTSLMRRDLTPQEVTSFHERLAENLTTLRAALQSETLICRRRVPPSIDLVPRLLTSLEVICAYTRSNFLAPPIGVR